MILVDSSVYIDWLRGRVDFPRMLEPWLRSGSLWTCGIVRVEVLRGIRHADQAYRLAEFFDLIPEVPCDAELWSRAAELAWKLDRSGIVLPLSDVVIGACALTVGARVITTDSHFQKIPGLRTSKVLPRN